MFFSKPNEWGPNGPFPPGGPSIEVGGEAPHLNRWVFPVGRGRVDPKNGVSRITSEWVGWLPGPS